MFCTECHHHRSDHSQDRTCCHETVIRSYDTSGNAVTEDCTCRGYREGK